MNHQPKDGFIVHLDDTKWERRPGPDGQPHIVIPPEAIHLGGKEYYLPNPYRKPE